MHRGNISLYTEGTASYIGLLTFFYENVVKMEELKKFVNIFHIASVFQEFFDHFHQISLNFIKEFSVCRGESNRRGGLAYDRKYFSQDNPYQLVRNREATGMMIMEKRKILFWHHMA